jgi:hypothetical protein
LTVLGEGERAVTADDSETRAEDSELQRESERIAQLIEDLGALAGAPVRQRAEELVRRLIHLYGEGLRRLMGIFAAGPLEPTARARLRDDALLSSLLVLHDLHPDADAAAEHDPGPDPAAAASPALVQIDLARGAQSGKRGGQA